MDSGSKGPSFEVSLGFGTCKFKRHIRSIRPSEMSHPKGNIFYRLKNVRTNFVHTTFLGSSLLERADSFEKFCSRIWNNKGLKTPIHKFEPKQLSNGRIGTLQKDQDANWRYVSDQSNPQLDWEFYKTKIMLKSSHQARPVVSQENDS